MDFNWPLFWGIICIGWLGGIMGWFCREIREIIRAQCMVIPSDRVEEYCSRENLEEDEMWYAMRRLFPGEEEL